MTLIACVDADQKYTPYFPEEMEVTPETKSKKAFKAYIEANADALCIIEPAHRFGLVGQGPVLTPRQCVGQAVTNHPRRTWFATIIEKDGVVTLK